MIATTYLLPYEVKMNSKTTVRHAQLTIYHDKHLVRTGL